MPYSKSFQKIIANCLLIDGEIYKYLKSGKLVKVENKKNHSGGYCKFYVDGCIVYYHRALWILSKGEDIPEGMQIDHIDGNKTNNVIENMRLVTNRQNGQNMKRHRNGNLVGAKYNKNSGKWNAQIRLNKGEQIHIGTFDTEEDAHNAYIEALQHIPS